MADLKNIEELARLVRYYILLMTTEAQSGHPTSSLSATDVMTDLFFNHLRSDLQDTANPANDRVIFSKGHVSPLVYALYAAAGAISEKELLTYRKFGSELEGHPTPKFKYAEVATGSLGQGLSVGLGMALAIRREFQISNFKFQIEDSPKVYVLMGDSEIAEGSVWEAAEIASYYKVSNLVAIVDVNRLGQSRETMLDWDMDTYKARFEAFGWEVFVIDGHNLGEIDAAFGKVTGSSGDRPKVILAKTKKGKGVSFWEDKEGWHGKPLPRGEFEKAVEELGFGKGKEASMVRRLGEGAIISKPDNLTSKPNRRPNLNLTINYKLGEEVATRKAYGEALAQLASEDPRIIALDGETSNSTFSELVKQKTPDQFMEMFIAEQNMTGVALGLSKRGYIPFASTFAAFWTRAFDQVRMSAYSLGNVKYVGSHSGVSIGEDGTSQMGLEDLALFKSVFGSVVFCPSDAVSTARLTEIAAHQQGIFYIRTARPVTPVIYSAEEKFEIGGSKVLKSSNEDKLTIVACGATVATVLGAYEVLRNKGITVRVVDAYSIKPIDSKGILISAQEAGKIVLTVEDHYFDGGLGDSVLNALSDFPVWVVKMAVCKMPMSGKPEELLKYEEIDTESIVKRVKELLSTKS